MEKTKFNQLDILGSHNFTKIINELFAFGDKKQLKEYKEGVCYGLSANFLKHEVNNNGSEYLSYINKLQSIINSKKNVFESKLERAYHKKEKQQAEQLLKNIIIDITEYQKNKNLSLDISEYNDFSHNIQLIAGETFLTNIERIYDYNNKYHPKKDQINFKDYNNKKLDLLKKYYFGITDPDYIKTPEGSEIIEHQAFKILKNNYENRSNDLIKKLKPIDIKSFIMMAENQLTTQVLAASDDITQKYGLIATNNTLNGGNYDYSSRKKLSAFIEQLRTLGPTPDDSYFHFISGNHAMAISVINDTETQQINYKFFDPNTGIKSYNNVDDFSENLTKFIKNNSKFYEFKKLENNDFEFRIREYKKSANNEVIKGVNKINIDDIHHSVINELLTNKKQFSLIKSKKSHLTLDEFIPANLNNSNHQIKITLNQKGNTTVIYTDNLDLRTLPQKILANKKQLTQFNSPLFISKEDGNIYTIDNSSQIKNIDISKIKDILGPPRGTIITSSKNKSIVRKVLNKLGLSEVKFDHITLDKHPAFGHYFMKSNGKLDINKVRAAIYDPLISQKVNSYFNHDGSLKAGQSDQWQTIFNLDLTQSLQQQAVDVQTLLTALGENPNILTNLSDSSIHKLQPLFAKLDGQFDRTTLFTTIIQPEELARLQQQLSNFIGLHHDNFEGNNAPLSHLNLKQALDTSIRWDTRLMAEHAVLSATAKEISPDAQVTLFKPIIRYQNTETIDPNDPQISLQYAFFLAQDKEHEFYRSLENMSQLQQKQHQGMLSIEESQLLTQYQQFYQSSVNNDNSTENNQSFKHLINSGITGQAYQIKAKNSPYTVLYQKLGDQHNYRFIDTNGIILTVNQSDFYQAQNDFTQIVTQYMQQQITLENGTTQSRGQLAGFDLSTPDDFSATFKQTKQTVLDDGNLLTRQWNNILTSPLMQPSDNFNVHFGKHDIAFNSLKNLGVTIDGTPLNASHLSRTDWYTNVRFDAKKLLSALTILGDNPNSTHLLQILKNQLDDNGIQNIIASGADIPDNAILTKQLTIIQQQIDADGAPVSASTLNELRTLGFKQPRYAKVINRAGQMMAGVGMIATINSLHSMITQLSHPDLTKEQRSELEEIIYISCASAFFNYGDIILQPILLNISYAKASSVFSSASMAGKISILFNLIGIGLDSYQAYKIFTQLETTSDPEMRQDLMVNAGLSISGITLSGITLIGVLAGSSVVPMVGLVIGGALLVGGMIYSGIRAVELIESYVDLSLEQKFIEGARAAIGLAPSTDTLIRINQLQYVAAFKEQSRLEEIERFRSSLLPAGFEDYLTVIGKPILQAEKKYYLYKNGSFFGGTYSVFANVNGTGEVYYSSQNAPTFTAAEADFIIRHYDLEMNGQMETVNIPGNNGYTKREAPTPKLIKTGIEDTNEQLIFNSEYSDPTLEAFKQRFSIPIDEVATLPLAEQLAKLADRELRLLSLQKDYASMDHPDLDDDIAIKILSETIVNDQARIAQLLFAPYRNGTSFNTANGNDIIIGKNTEENGFIAQQGAKYFVGGDKNDLFQLWDTSTNIYSSAGVNLKQKYFDALQGQDTLEICALPDGYNADISLSSQQIIYRQAQGTQTINVGELKNFQNIIVKTPVATDDNLRGNADNNLLDGGAGKDTLFGDDGDDQLVLTEGEAIGGEGNDSYYIQRLSVEHTIKDFHQIKDVFDEDKKTLSQKTMINPKYSPYYGEKIFSHSIIINENTSSDSQVSLAYSLDEIEHVSVSGTDLKIKVGITGGTLEGRSYAHLKSKIELVFKNVYRHTDNGRQLNHQYHLQTRDGFQLTSILKHLTVNSPNEINANIFNISYLQDLDREKSTINSVNFDQPQQMITINNDRKYNTPAWGIFTPIGMARNFVYTGDDRNNQVTAINRNSLINVSRGQDIYQITPDHFEQNEIIFDFSQVSNLGGTTQYGEQDKVIITLPTENGFQLKMENNTLHLKGPLGQQKLAIRFQNFDQLTANNVLIQDQYNNLFNIQLDAFDSQITPINQLTPTQKDNIKVIAKGDSAENGLIDLRKSKNSLPVVDLSNSGHVIIGGDKDDSISATGGYNALYGGAGNNHLQGGNKSDLLLSLQGNDTLQGQQGNDHYLIDGNGNKSTVYIDDDWGHNRIHLVNFDSSYRVKTATDGTVLHRYTSATGRVVNIKQPTIDKNAQNQVHHYGALTEILPNLDSANLDDFVNHLTVQAKSAKLSPNFNPWRPMDEFSSTLQGREPTLELRTNNINLDLNRETSQRYNVIDLPYGYHRIDDESEHGRVIKGNSLDDNLFVSGGNNLLSGGGGNNNLSAGKDNDLLISSGHNDNLYSGGGKTVFVIDGYSAGRSFIIDPHKKDSIYLIGFNTTPTTRQNSTDGTNEYIYESDHGRKVTISATSLNSKKQAPSIYHHKELPGLVDSNQQQRIDYLVSALATQYLTATESQLASGGTQHTPWDPTMAFEGYIRRAS